MPIPPLSFTFEPKIVERPLHPLGDKILSYILSDNHDVHAFNKAREMPKISPFAQAHGILGYTKATLKTIWAAFIYLLKAPVAFLCGCFGYEPFLDRTLLKLVAEYNRLVADITPDHATHLVNFLLRIRDLAATSDQILIEQLIQNPPHRHLGHLLEKLAPAMALRYLDTHLDSENFSPEAFYSYIDSLNESMAHEATFGIEDLDLTPQLRDKLKALMTPYLGRYSPEDISERARAIRKHEQVNLLCRYQTLAKKSVEEEAANENRAKIDEVINFSDGLDPLCQDFTRWNSLSQFSKGLGVRPIPNSGYLDYFNTLLFIFKLEIKNAKVGFSKEEGDLPDAEEIASLTEMTKEHMGNEIQKYHQKKSPLDKACILDKYLRLSFEVFFYPLTR